MTEEEETQLVNWGKDRLTRALEQYIDERIEKKFDKTNKLNLTFVAYHYWYKPNKFNRLIDKFSDRFDLDYKDIRVVYKRLAEYYRNKGYNFTLYLDDEGLCLPLPYYHINITNYDIVYKKRVPE